MAREKMVPSSTRSFKLNISNQQIHEAIKDAGKNFYGILKL